ncbi:MAG: hypothetical protein MUC28_02895 [Planctomycetes bacterium]|jgi:hypothetical protein|nr:hypothetical protein [Planctomycetota bacterium]
MAKGGKKSTKNSSQPAAPVSARRKKYSLPVRQVRGSLVFPVGREKTLTAAALRTKEEKRTVVAHAINYEEEKIKGGRVSAVNLMPAGAPFIRSAPSEQRRALSAQSRTAAKPITAGGPEQEEKAKRMMMYSGVIFFMLLVIGGWIYNMQQSISRTKAENAGEATLADWREMTAEISEKMEEMKEGLSEIQSFDAGQNSATGTMPASEDELFLSSSTTELTPAEIETLKDKLEDLTNSSASSTEPG